jgi:hypothetical protein
MVSNVIKSMIYGCTACDHMQEVSHAAFCFLDGILGHGSRCIEMTGLLFTERR